MRGVVQAAKIPKRVSPHLLRHKVATCLLVLGVDFTDLQIFLGYVSTATHGITPRPQPRRSDTGSIS